MMRHFLASALLLAAHGCGLISPSPLVVSAVAAQVELPTRPPEPCERQAVERAE